MTTKPYTPQTGSIAHQVCRYFQRLTDEELSTADISIKWNIESGNVLNLLGKAIAAGLLARDGKIYSAGPKLHTLPVDRADSLESGALLGHVMGTRPKRGVKERINLAPDEFEALQVEEGVPAGPPGPKPGVSKWGPLFDKLTAPGLSVAVPVDWKKTLGSEVTKRNADARKAGQTERRWKVGNDPKSSLHARLWRLS